MRSFKVTMVLCSLMLVLTPTRAQAWFELLDYLSGPGRFYGPKFDFRVWCFGETATGKQITEARNLFASAIAKSLAPPNDAVEEWRRLVSQLKQINGSFHVLDDTRIDKLVAGATALRTEEIVKFKAQYTELLARRAKDANAAAPPADQESVLFGFIDDVASEFDQLYRAEASIASTGIFVSFCSPDKLRRFALEMGVTSLQANSDPAYAHDYTIRLNAFTGALSYRVLANPDHDFLDVGFIGGVYQFSSRGFDTFRGGIVEPFADLHGPTNWINDCGLRQLFALLTLRVGLVWFPAGFDTEQFAAAPAKLRHISGWEATPSATIFLNLTPLLRHRPRIL